MIGGMETAMKLILLPCIAALALTGCSVLPQGSGDSRDGGASSTVPSPARTTPPLSQRPVDRQCLAGLGQAGVQFDTLPDRYLGEGCSNLNTVQMHALAGDNGRLEVRNLGPVTCAVSSAFAAWVRYGVDRAARQVFGSSLASIQTMGSFNCRNVAGTSRRSAHASADAIDVGAFILADGRRISVVDGWSGSKQEREFLRLVQRSACRRFDTVLSPDYNAAHRDHIHLEGVIEGNSYCR